LEERRQVSGRGRIPFLPLSRLPASVCTGPFQVRRFSTHPLRRHPLSTTYGSPQDDSRSRCDTCTPMWSTFLGKRKARRSDRTPLLAALHRYQSRESHRDHSASDDDLDYGTARYDGEDEDDEDGVSAQRDGPLLPVFSSEFLGMAAEVRPSLLH
jgi:hypothetical protein